jgi:ferric-dicitrate binding protein FerR (iron transport regulator)
LSTRYDFEIRKEKERVKNKKMKLNEKITGHAKQIARYIHEEMPEHERETFRALVESDPSNSLLIERIIYDMEKVDQKIKGTSWDVEGDWNALYTRLERDELLGHEKSKSRFRVSQFVRVAASVAAVMVLATLAWIWSRPDDSPSIVVENFQADNQSIARELPDGSLVVLAPGATLSYKEQFESDVRKVVVSGNLFFEVEPDADRPFVVEADEHTLQVLGTSFDLKSHNKQFELVVLTGVVSVRATSMKSESRRVEAGKKITREGETYLLTDWNSNRQGLVVNSPLWFKDERLGNILEVISKTRGARIVAVNEEVASRRITMRIDDESPELLVDLISKTLNLGVKLEKDTFYLLPSVDEGL